MKKIIFLLLFLPFLTLAQENRTGKVFEAVNSAKAISGNFQSFEIFNSQTRSAITDYSEAVNDGVVVAIDLAKINNLLDQNPKQINLSIPLKSNGETIALDLIEVAVFSPDFKAVTNTGQDITNEVDFGKHYRGVIAGNSNSLVSISVFENQINGFIANAEGNYTIGKLKDSDINHIIYKDSDLKTTQELICANESDGVGYTEEELTPPANRQDPGDIIEIYIEAGQSVYNAHGGNLANTVAFLTALYAQSYVLYANDGILVRTSSMMVWIHPDPYTDSDSLGQLNEFTQRATQIGFDGDLGQLVERQPGSGGIAWLNTLCSPTNNKSFAGLDGITFNNVPTYSWNVMVISHEMGHNMGSSHTHACVWNGDNTAIDGCAPVEGGCPRPPSPPGGGTIMSYCHFTTGINFNLGFGPQPTALILNRIANAGCLDPDDVLIPPTAVCKTMSLLLEDSGGVTITAADIDGGSFDDDGIASMTIDINTLDCDDIGENRIVLTVTDTDGLTSYCTAIVEVIYIEVTNCPEDFTDITAEGSPYDIPDFRDDIEATDNCTGAAASIVVLQSPSPGTQVYIGVTTITLTVLDYNTGDLVTTCIFDLTVEIGLGLGETTELSSLILYPNPARDLVQLSNPQNLDLETLSIYDMMGRLIKTVDLKDMGSEMSIDLSDLADSNYFAIIQGSQNKIIKQLIKR